jgi:hypothetical protein
MRIRGDLPVVGIEIEHGFLNGLGWAGRVFPSHHSLRSILGQHGIATLALDFRNRPVRKHSCLEPNLSFKVTIPEDVGVLGFCHHQDLAVGLRRALGDKLRSAAGNQTKQYSKRNYEEAALEALQTANARKSTIFHKATPRLKV